MTRNNEKENDEGTRRRGQNNEERGGGSMVMKHERDKRDGRMRSENDKKHAKEDGQR